MKLKEMLVGLEGLKAKGNLDIGHDYRYAIDPSKISKELGWLPKTKFEDGIVKTIDWYLANPEWLK